MLPLSVTHVATVMLCVAAQLVVPVECTATTEPTITKPNGADRSALTSLKLYG